MVHFQDLISPHHHVQFLVGQTRPLRARPRILVPNSLLPPQLEFVTSPIPTTTLLNLYIICSAPLQQEIDHSGIQGVHHCSCVDGFFFNFKKDSMIKVVSS
jgi:hypothetical protein